MITITLLISVLLGFCNALANMFLAVVAMILKGLT